MELFLARVYPETIKIIERWSINYFLRYIWIQVRKLRKGIIALIVTIQAFYKIPEAEKTTLRGNLASNLTGYTHNEESQIKLLPPSCYHAKMSPRE